MSASSPTARLAAPCAGLIAVALAAASLATASAPQAPPLFPAPTVNRDPIDAGAGGLDLRTAQLAQTATRFTLRISTQRPWNAATLDATAARALCVVLVYGTPARPRSELCVKDESDATTLGRALLDAQRRPVGTPRRTDAIAGHSGAVLTASFSPRDVSLPYGPFRWYVTSRWAGGSACSADAPCSDRLPAHGSIQGRAVLLAEPRCFGAASRDPQRPCHNPQLARTVLPTPEDALITPNAYCLPGEDEDLVRPCQFGLGADRARETIALIGDSHAGHWRGGVEVAAQSLRWRGISITRSSCPFSLRVRNVGTVQQRRRCGAYSNEVIGWLDRHPEVHTVLTSDHSQRGFTAKDVRGYAAAYAAIPSSVRHIIVLRDDPAVFHAPTTCIDHLLATHQPVGDRCSAARSRVLNPDPAALAATASADPRLAVIDLTSSMCSAALCFAVVGGVLVHKDANGHLTSTFSTTLGPLLLRRLRALGVT